MFAKEAQGSGQFDTRNVVFLMDATVLRYAFIRLLDLGKTAETFRSFLENGNNRIMIW